jgi:hypothetical protein
MECGVVLYHCWIHYPISWLSQSLKTQPASSATLGPVGIPPCPHGRPKDHPRAQRSLLFVRLECHCVPSVIVTAHTLTALTHTPSQLSHTHPHSSHTHTLTALTHTPAPPPPAPLCFIRAPAHAPASLRSSSSSHLTHRHLCAARGATSAPSQPPRL